jgi:4-hydroxybenzoate polyprenyltransferase and related prenyltransferases
MDNTISLNTGEAVNKNKPADIRDYISIARIDNWVKNIFMVPGMLFAIAYFKTGLHHILILKVIIGFFSTCFIASANYVINEYLDIDFDRFHPVKKNRSLVHKQVSAKIITVEYIIIAMIGLGMAYFISLKFLIMEAMLLIMGIIYNVKPLRSKERVYLDVLTESINNPIRFALGWFIFSPSLGMPDNKWDLEWFNTLPPVSIIIAYWMGGAFLMATKRFAEYRAINDAKIAGMYRRSFKFYTENSLLISMFFYAITCAFFLGIFLVKNRIELLLTFPFFALLFSWYLKIGLLEDSPVQGVKGLHKRKWFMLYLVLFTILLCILMFVNIPWIHWFLKNANN